MSDHAPLTDEELAEIERAALRVRHGISFVTRADAVLRLIADLRASRAEVERLRAGLDFYADPENWEAKFRSRAPGVEVFDSGPAVDGGDKARRALNVPLP